MKKVELNKYNNSWYNPGKKIKIFFWYFFSRSFINTTFPYPYSFKKSILKLFGATIGKGVVFKQKVSIKYPWLLTIKDNSWIGENVWIDNLAYVTIEENVSLSQGSMLLTGNHNYSKSTFDLIIGKIHIKEGAWIGAKAVVCPGVTIGSHAVLSVGSIATNNLDSYSIYQGNPAILKKKRVIS